MTVTILSMIMTFVLYCTLKDTRASGFIYQTLAVDPGRDLLIFIRCFSKTEQSKFTKKIFVHFY